MKKYVILAGATLLAGCVPPPLYNWGSYESSLYGYYKNPAQQEEYLAALAEVANSSDAYEATHVPPGLYAEYGFMMMKAGKTSEAQAFFRKEQEKWPESALFMQTLIKGLSPAPATAAK